MLEVGGSSPCSGADQLKELACVISFSKQTGSKIRLSSNKCIDFRPRELSQKKSWGTSCPMCPQGCSLSSPTPKCLSWSQLLVWHPALCLAQ